MDYDRLHKTLVLKYGTWEKPKEVYTERHRIVPGCVGGRYSKGNAFYVPARVHFIAHYLLAKVYPDNVELGHALFRMSNSKKYGSKTYSWAKEHWANLIRGENNPAKRDEVRKKISDNNPMKDPAMVKKAAEWSRSEEGRKHMSDRVSGENNPSCRLDVKVKRAEHMKMRHASGDESIRNYGENSPMRDPEIKAKIIATRSNRLKEAKLKGEKYGLYKSENHCMKTEEHKLRASNSAKNQWKDPEIRAKMCAAIKAAYARNKLLKGD